MKVRIINNITSEGCKILLNNDIDSVFEVLFTNCDGPRKYLMMDKNKNIKYLSLEHINEIVELNLEYSEFLRLFNNLYSDGDFVTIKRTLEYEEELYVLKFRKIAREWIEFHGSYWEGTNYHVIGKVKLNFGFRIDDKWDLMGGNSIESRLSTKEEIENYETFYEVYMDIS